MPDDDKPFMPPEQPPNWFDTPVTAANETPVPFDAVEANEDLEEIFDDLLAHHDNDFLNDVYNWYQEKGWITQAQYQGIMRWYANL